MKKYIFSLALLSILFVPVWGAYPSVTLFEKSYDRPEGKTTCRLESLTEKHIVGEPSDFLLSISWTGKTDLKNIEPPNISFLNFVNASISSHAALRIDDAIHMRSRTFTYHTIPQLIGDAKIYAFDWDIATEGSPSLAVSIPDISCVVTEDALQRYQFIFVVVVLFLCVLVVCVFVFYIRRKLIRMGKDGVHG